MSYLLPHLHSAYAVDQAIVTVSYIFLSSSSPCSQSLTKFPFPGTNSQLEVIFLFLLPLQEEARVVIIRFGHDWDETCMQMDEILSSTTDKMKNFAVTYLVDITEVPDFNAMYELYDPCTVMFFFRNKVSNTNLRISKGI